MATDRIRLVASDMDATLLDEHSCLPQGFAGMVHALAQKNIREFLGVKPPRKNTRRINSLKKKSLELFD